MEQLTIGKIGNRSIEVRARKRPNNFQLFPCLQIEHKKYTGFAVVIGWGHWRAGVKFERID